MYLKTKKMYYLQNCIFSGIDGKTTLTSFIRTPRFSSALQTATIRLQRKKPPVAEPCFFQLSWHNQQNSNLH